MTIAIGTVSSKVDRCLVSRIRASGALLKYSNSLRKVDNNFDNAAN